MESPRGLLRRRGRSEQKTVREYAEDTGREREHTEVCTKEETDLKRGTGVSGPLEVEWEVLGRVCQKGLEDSIDSGGRGRKT